MLSQHRTVSYLFKLDITRDTSLEIDFLYRFTHSPSHKLVNGESTH